MADAYHDEEHVQVKFSTELKRFVVPETPFSLTTDVGCSELNSLLKGLLVDGDKELPDIKFDYLIEGELLRTSLKEFIINKKLQTESVIEIEYILKEDAPEFSKNLPHNDWVSSIDIGFGDLILTGCYDNTLSLWNLNGDCIGIMEGHSMPVKSVSS